jgi:hypothetical protein
MMADELIRFKLIKSFIFQPNVFLSFAELNYNLSNSELLIIQSLLNKDYFKDLYPDEKTNAYATHETFDTVNPFKHAIAPTTIHITKKKEDEQEKEKGKEQEKEMGKNGMQVQEFDKDNECVEVTKSTIKSKYWKKCFPPDYKEIKYQNSEACTFYLVIHIVKFVNGEMVTIDELKNMLYEEYYNTYLTDYKDRIIEILKMEGKKDLCDKWLAKELTFKEMIMSKNYFVSHLDLLILMKKFKISSLLISSGDLILRNRENNNLILYSGNCDNNENNEECLETNTLYIVIYSSGLRNGVVPNYSIIMSANDDVLIKKGIIKCPIDNEISIEQILSL